MPPHLITMLRHLISDNVNWNLTSFLYFEMHRKIVGLIGNKNSDKRLQINGYEKTYLQGILTLLIPKYIYNYKRIKLVIK